MSPNPLPPLAREFVPPANLVWQKSVRCNPHLPIERRAYEEELDDSDVTKVMPTPAGYDITTPDGTGSMLLFDFGKVQTGHVTFTLEATGGEEIEIAVSEQLPGEWSPDGIGSTARITRKPLLGHDAHVTRYVARPGHQTFTRFSWQAVKWMQVSVRHAPVKLHLSKVGVIQTNYPVENAGRFSCSDPMLTQLWSTGAYTLKLCMHDGWEDCPGREQRQWLGDATVEQLVGQVAFGPAVNPLNAKFLRDAAASQRPDGLTQMFAPGNHGRDGLLIPDWTLQWILNARQHLLWSGDVTTIEEIFPAIQRALAWFEKLLNANSLIADMPYWHFMDWAGLGRHGEACALNAQLAGCFTAAAEMATTLAMPRAADKYHALACRIQQSLNSRHWDARRGIYVDCVDPETGVQELRVSQHANAAMIMWGNAPEERWAEIVDRISDPSRQTFTAALPIVPSGDTLDPEAGVVLANTFYSHFVQSAFLKAGRADLVLALLHARYAPMLARGATTLWESFEPTASLCHGFSATPTYQLTTGILGLQPAADGFAKLRIAPQPCGLAFLHGRLATVHGDISASLHQQADGFDMTVEIPENLPCEIVAPHGFSATTESKNDTLHIQVRQHRAVRTFP
jgi:alpha-L-rhamnosidase